MGHEIINSRTGNQQYRFKIWGRSEQEMMKSWTGNDEKRKNGRENDQKYKGQAMMKSGGNDE